jgi:hypothetical protein
VLIALAFLFFAPVAVAFILYYGLGWSPGGRVNHGDLVQPPVPLPDLTLPRVAGPEGGTPQADEGRRPDALSGASSASAASAAGAAGAAGAASAAGGAGAGGAAPVVSSPAEVPRAAAPPSLLKGKWTLLYLGAGACPVGCRTDLYNTRQVRAALGAERTRVQRVFLAEGACCDLEWLHTQQPDLITVQASAAAAPLTAILEHAGRSPGATDRVYLIDPLGNLMMSYAADARPKGMLEDLKKLLRLSHVG